MSSNDQSNPFTLREAHFAALHRDVLVHEELDETLSRLSMPSQGIRNLCHDELSHEHQQHMLQAIAKMAADVGMEETFELVIANLAIERRNWDCMAELGVHGVSFSEHSLHDYPNGSKVGRLTMPGYYEGAEWRFADETRIPRIHGEGRIEQVARHLGATLIALAAVRHSAPEVEQ